MYPKSAFGTAALILTSLMINPVYAKDATSTAQPALAAPGLIEPASEERLIGSEIIGTLREVPVEENDVIKAGQVLAIVKNDDQTARLLEAKAGLDAAKARKELADIEFRRRTALVSRQNASQAELDIARAEVGVTQAQLMQATAFANLAQANLDKTLITSPIDGVVLKKMVVAGQAVSNQPPTPIAIIGDLSKLRVRAEVDEIDLSRLQLGQRVVIKADGYPDLKAGGTVIRVNQRMGSRQIQTDRADEKSDNRVIQAMIELDAGVKLPVGLRVDVFFIPQAKPTPAK